MFLLDGCPSINSSRFYTWTFIFLVYINALPNNLTSNRKLFADDTSLFSTVVDLNATANQINNDLHNNNKCAYQWKMNFKREVTFSLIFFSTIIQYMNLISKGSWNISRTQAKFSRTF